MEINTQNILKRKELYSQVYKQVLADALAENSPFDKLQTTMSEYFENFKIPDTTKMEIVANALTTLCQSVSVSSQEIALKIILESERIDLELQKLQSEIELTKEQGELAKKEALLTAERVKLVTAQTDNEKEKIPLIQREIKVHDDNLRIEEAKLLKDVLNGYAIGGLNIPTGLHETVLNGVNKVNPNG